MLVEMRLAVVLQNQAMVVVVFRLWVQDLELLLAASDLDWLLH